MFVPQVRTSDIDNFRNDLVYIFIHPQFSSSNVLDALTLFESICNWPVIQLGGIISCCDGF